MSFSVVRTAACVVFASLVFASTSARAALTAYYTLDNKTSGIQNLGTDGATSNLTEISGSSAAVVPGIIGGAVGFSGSYLTAEVAGNAGDDLSAYPFSFSLWVKSSPITGRAAALSVTLSTAADQYFQVGAEANNIPEMVVRNGAFQEVNSTANIGDAQWHQLTAVYVSGAQRIYVDGKLSGTGTFATAFPTNLNALAIGGLRRSTGAPTPSDPFPGAVDDVGLFTNALVDADAALINGLGRTGAIGLDQLDEAQALFASADGSTALIGGATWQRVSGLSGAVGDWSGSISGGNAAIVAGAGGAGLQLVATAIPEPSTWAALILFGCAGIALRRRAPGA